MAVGSLRDQTHATHGCFTGRALKHLAEPSKQTELTHLAAKFRPPPNRCRCHIAYHMCSVHLDVTNVRFPMYTSVVLYSQSDLI